MRQHMRSFFQPMRKLPHAMFGALFGAAVFDQYWTWFVPRDARRTSSEVQAIDPVPLTAVASPRATFGKAVQWLDTDGTPGVASWTARRIGRDGGDGERPTSPR